MKLAKSETEGNILSNFNKNLNKSFSSTLGSDNTPIKSKLNTLINSSYDVEEDEDVISSLGMFEDMETNEATTSASSGSYETPAFLAKSMGKKDWRGASKRMYPGGKFVKVKEKCKKYPYCNQGDINALELFEKNIMKETIQKVSKNTGKNSEYIKGLVEKELKEIIKRSFYGPSNGRLTDDKKIKTPISKMFTQKKKNK
jgi:hypothetical protein